MSNVLHLVYITEEKENREKKKREKKQITFFEEC